MDKLQALESFVTAIEAGGVSAAASRIGTAKSVISRRISDLEAHLGVRLLHRGARTIKTTIAGETFYAEARRVLSELAHAEAQVRERHDSPRGILRIAAPMSFSTLHLNSLIVELARTYPDLTFDLEYNDRVIDLASEGFDAAVRLGSLRVSSLVARTIAPNRHLICASPAYLDLRGRPTSPSDLAGHDGLLYTPREPHGMWQIELSSRLQSYRVRTRMRCNNGETLQAAALAGMGLAILPTFMAAPHLKTGALEAVLPEHVLPGGSISVLYVRDRRKPIGLQILIDAMLATYSPTPPWDLG